jgi:hypothetical protein
MAFGVGLAIVGLSALFGMSTVNLAEARAVEHARHELELKRQEQMEKSRRELESSAQLPAPVSGIQ